MISIRERVRQNESRTSFSDLVSNPNRSVKTIDVYVENQHAWTAHMNNENAREHERLEAVSQGFKSVAYSYHGPAVRAFYDRINSDMKKFHREYLRKSVQSEQASANIVFNS